MYFGYLQDDWKLTRRAFRLNLGLRYEFATPTREKNMQMGKLRSRHQQTYIAAKEGSLRDEALIGAGPQ